MRLNRRKSHLPKSALHSRLMKSKSDDRYNNQTHGGPCHCFRISKLGKNKGILFFKFCGSNDGFNLVGWKLAISP